MTMTEELTQRIASAERNRDNLKAAEARLAKASERGDTSGTTVVRTSGNGGARPFGMPSKKMNGIDYLIRQGVVEYFSHKMRKSHDEVRTALYGEDDATKAYVDYTTKAASSAANTAVAGWAAELIQQVYTDFMQLLVPSSVLPRLSTLGLALTFGRAGRIIIPTRNLTPSLAGSFVGEGQPIPVRQGAFTSQTLVPKKLAVISTWTREMDEHSAPAIEGLLRDAIQIDTSIALDTVLLDANPATAIRPAGLRNGVAGLTATAGGGFNALVGDIKQTTGALLTTNAGHIRSGVLIMKPQQILSIGLTQPPAAATGLFPFAQEVAGGRLRSFGLIDSGNVPLGTILALDAADFVSVGSEAPRFEVSDQATLHMEDTSPADITGGTPSPAIPVKSMFQTDSIALRLVWPMNWTLRRPGMVSWISGVTW
jgi:HK97 family phage major capsid protein